MFLLFPVFNLLLVHSAMPVINGVKCGVLPSDLIDCAKKYGVDRIPSDSVGYGFGFGSIDAVENMCRTKWHLRVYVCAHQTVLSRCSGDRNSQFRERMWQFMFDTTRYARAALYFCKSHNLKIFRAHLYDCFMPLEKNVEVCSKKYALTVSAATSRLATYNPTNMTNEASYADYMQREITLAHCVGTMEKIECVSQVLKPLCSPDAISLIQNYYRETLPENCERKPKSFLDRNRARILIPTKRATVFDGASLYYSAPRQRDVSSYRKPMFPDARSKASRSQLHWTCLAPDKSIRRLFGTIFAFAFYIAAHRQVSI